MKRLTAVIVAALLWLAPGAASADGLLPQTNLTGLDRFCLSLDYEEVADVGANPFMMTSDFAGVIGRQASVHDFPLDPECGDEGDDGPFLHVRVVGDQRGFVAVGSVMLWVSPTHDRTSDPILVTVYQASSLVTYDPTSTPQDDVREAMLDAVTTVFEDIVLAWKQANYRDHF